MRPPIHEMDIALGSFLESNDFDRSLAFMHKIVHEAFSAGFSSGWESGLRAASKVVLMESISAQTSEPGDAGDDEPQDRGVDDEKIFFMGTDNIEKQERDEARFSGEGL